jgi:hypothetical protein
MAVLKEYRRREEEFLRRAKDLDETTNLRDAEKQKYDSLRKQRLDEFMAGCTISLKCCTPPRWCPLPVYEWCKRDSYAKKHDCTVRRNGATTRMLPELRWCRLGSLKRTASHAQSHSTLLSAPSPGVIANLEAGPQLRAAQTTVR